MRQSTGSYLSLVKKRTMQGVKLHQRIVAMTLAAVFVCGGQLSSAAVWTPTAAGPFDFNTATNWTGSVLPTTGTIADLQTANITAAQTVNVSDDITIGSLSIGDNSTSAGSVFGYTLTATAGKAITISGGSAGISKPSRTNNVLDVINVPLVLGSNTTVTNNGSSGNLELRGAISSLAGIDLSIANTGGSTIVTGDIVGFNGNLKMTTGNASQVGGQVSFSTNTVNGQNAKFNIANAGAGGGVNLTAAANRFFRWGATPVSGTEDAVIKMGELSGNGWINPQTGGGNITNYTYEIGSLNTDSAFGGVIIGRTATNIVKVGTGSLTLSGPLYSTGTSMTTTVSSGTLIAGSNAISSNVYVSPVNTTSGSSDITLANHSLQVGDRVTFTGTVAGGLTATTNYVVHTVTDANTFKVAHATTPATAISLTTTASGAMTMSEQGAFGSGTAAVKLGDANTGNNAVTLLTGGPAGTVIERAITVTDTGSSGVAGIGGIGLVNSSFTGLVTLTRDLTVAQNTNGGALNVTGGLAGAGANAKTITFGSATVVPTFAPNGFLGNVNVGSAISEAGGGVVGVNIAGGVTTFSAANNYTGSTTITAGTLALVGSGSISSSALIDVQNGGTLDVSAIAFTLGGLQTLMGEGDVLGSVTLDGNVAPGSSPGTLSILGNVTLNGTLTAEVADPLADLLDITGDLTLGGASTLNLPLANTYNPLTTYTLLQFTGSRNGTFAFETNVPGTHTVQYAANSIQLIPVPEPTAILLFGVGLLGVGVQGRRRVRKAKG
jgi:autotransporter-associated beta strand protein